MSLAIHNRIGMRQSGILAGDPVVVTRDDGSKFFTTATSEPWQMGATWVIRVNGIDGAYALCRVRPGKGGAP